MNSPFVILQKPPEGEPCNHCGECCRLEACLVSKTFLQSSVAPCIALEVDAAGRMLCGVLLHPAKYLHQDHLAIPGEIRDRVDDALRTNIRFLLAAGEGCTMSDDQEGVAHRLARDRV